MTIRLRSAIFISGVHQAVGTSLTLDAAMEADLVNRGDAVYTNRPLSPGDGITPASFGADASGNTVLLGRNGDFLVVSADAPDDSDGRADGTIYIQTAA